MDSQEVNILILMKYFDSSFNRQGQICLADLGEMASEDSNLLLLLGEVQVWVSCKEVISLKNCLRSIKVQEEGI